MLATSLQAVFARPSGLSVNRPRTVRGASRIGLFYRAAAGALEGTLDEIVAVLGRIEAVEISTPIPVEFDGFPATEIEGTGGRLAVLWENRSELGGGGVDNSWNLEPGQRIRLIIVSSPAGSLVITVQAAGDDWDAFLPVAEEILAGISFPDLN